MKSLSLNFVIKTAVLVVACGVLSFGCGGDDDSGTNENHHYFDAAVDAIVWPDAYIDIDAAEQIDAAHDIDAFVEIDGAVVGEGEIGDPCSAHGDCIPPAGLTAECMTVIGEGFLQVEFPGGYCSADCTPGEPDPCAPGGVCVDLQIASKCLEPCQQNSDCRETEGYECDDPMNMAGQTVCVPPIGMMP